jgi:nitrate reductase alpha subunit
MKTLTLLTAFVFSVLMFSSTSVAEWKWVGENVNGSNHYVDFERIRKQDGYVYFWGLNDLLKPDKDGNLSHKLYTQSDCELFRFKGLSVSFYKEPMGRGTPSKSSNKPENDWRYPHPDSTGEVILKFVCEYAN